MFCHVDNTNICPKKSCQGKPAGRKATFMWVLFAQSQDRQYANWNNQQFSNFEQYTMAFNKLFFHSEKQTRND
jgi:hypothetical protein